MKSITNGMSEKYKIEWIKNAVTQTNGTGKVCL
jgi:hypothetical protein